MLTVLRFNFTANGSMLAAGRAGCILPYLARRLLPQGVLGWSMANHLRTELVADALETALWRRRPVAGLIHHTDRGAQYTAPSFGKRLEEAGIVPSMGRAGSALDNAISESFVASLKTELSYGHRFLSREASCQDGRLRLRRRVLRPGATSPIAGLREPL